MLEHDPQYQSPSPALHSSLFEPAFVPSRHSPLHHPVAPTTCYHMSRAPRNSAREASVPQLDCEMQSLQVVCCWHCDTDGHVVQYQLLSTDEQAPLLEPSPVP